MNRIEDGINSYLSGDVNSAIKYLESYINDEKPPQGQVYYYLGLSYGDIGKGRQAGEYFQKAIELEPNKGMYHYRLAIVYSQMMLFQQAIPHLKKTIEQNSEHVRAHFILGTIYFKNGELDAAAEQFKKVTQISPNYAAGFYELGNSLYYSGDAEGAKKAYQKAVELGDSFDADYKLALIFVNEGKFEEGIKHIQTAVDKGLCDIAAICHFAMQMGAAGEAEGAKNLLERMGKNFPNSMEIMNSTQMLDNL